MVDVPPQDAEILNLIGAGLSPDELIRGLMAMQYPETNVIEALQRAIEREKITLNSEGLVVAVSQFAEAA